MLLKYFEELTYYRVGFMIKTFITMALTILPIIIMIKCMIDFFKIIINPDESKKAVRTIAQRFVIGLIVFLIPVIINYIFHELTTYDDSIIVKFYEKASPSKIREYEKLAAKEKKEELNKREAEAKEAAIMREQENRKKNEEMEEIQKEYEKKNPQQGNNNPQGNGNTTSQVDTTNDNGSYGGVTVKDGTFYIPNKRATSDADTPKQSENYGLNPIFWGRLEKLINDAKAQGYSVSITSGWRPYSKQRELWDNSNRPCSERSKWVACPGGSRHGFGIAADLKFNGSSCDQSSWDCNSAAKWVHDNAASYGLKFRMSWEPWHIEPDKVSGGSFGSCTASC